MLTFAGSRRPNGRVFHSVLDLFGLHVVRSTCTSKVIRDAIGASSSTIGLKLIDIVIPRGHRPVIRSRQHTRRVRVRVVNHIDRIDSDRDEDEDVELALERDRTKQAYMYVTVPLWSRQMIRLWLAKSYSNPSRRIGWC
jgi:hypothetical protein